MLQAVGEDFGYHLHIVEMIVAEWSHVRFYRVSKIEKPNVA